MIARFSWTAVRRMRWPRNAVSGSNNETPKQSFEATTPSRGAFHRCHWLLLIALLPTLCAEDVIVRTDLTPETVWVGQRMQLQIDVLGKDGWAQIADLSELEVPGSYVRPAGNSRVRLNETIQGQAYTGQRYELSIYPQRSGPQELPSIDLTIKIQTWGTQAKAEPVQIATEAIPFTTRLPKGANPNLPVIVSADFTATQTWEPDQNEFKVGNALKRQITIKAVDLPAMVLPPISNTAVDGLATYPETPVLEDADQTAIRRESISYLFEQNARATVPSYTFQWWNPESETLKQITLEGRVLTVTGGATEPIPSEKDSQVGKISFALLTTGILGITWLVYNCSKRSKTHPTLNEQTNFKKVINAAKRNAHAETLNCLIAWLDCIDERPSHFFNSHADEPTRTRAIQLLTDPHSATGLREFARGLRQARKHHRKTKQLKISKAEAALPSLNL